VRPTKASKPAAEFSARGLRGSNRLGNQIAAEAISDKAKKQDAHSLNAVLLPDEYLGRLGYRLSAKHARVWVVDGDSNYPRARPLMPVWISVWDGELELPSVVVWVGSSYSDAVRWLHAQLAARSSESGFIDRLRRGPAHENP
jgi:hypothetical protein